MGIGLGTSYGSFNEGIGINVSLLLASSSLKFTVEDGHVFAKVAIKVSFDGSYDGKFQII